MFEAKATKLVTNESEAKNTNQSESNELTERFPQELPMENYYELSRYFVRSCYPEYYDLILKKLEEFQIVTVTGTTGIGMSVFYGYFFERCKSGKTIIAASFSTTHNLKKIVVFRDGIQISEAGPLFPNDNWMSSMDQEERECTLHMPLWRKDELLVTRVHDLADKPRVMFEMLKYLRLLCYSATWLSTRLLKKAESTNLDGFQAHGHSTGEGKV
ncbi:hypothetical protein PHMEG_00025190 [Phytophthora megakarya]|uniref:Uncharacterized protein n=1 Tax=Phytophthora megakarya TaxID=4795 RepID=A0A225VCN6_9STRA|nr:hypothetical protein PHMEG_00025190 [Phytophthora megakarya]